MFSYLFIKQGGFMKFSYLEIANNSKGDMFTISFDTNQMNEREIKSLERFDNFSWWESSGDNDYVARLSHNGDRVGAIKAILNIFDYSLPFKLNVEKVAQFVKEYGQIEMKCYNSNTCAGPHEMLVNWNVYKGE
jgi:hypothetical protein